FLSGSLTARDLHSFPTRRSSDLAAVRAACFDLLAAASAAREDSNAQDVSPRRYSNLGRLELRWRGGQSFGVGGGYSAGRSSWIRGPSRPASNYTRCARAFNPVRTAFVVPVEFEFHGQVKP